MSLKILEKIDQVPRKILSIRLKTPSERIVSLFSKYHFECIGLCFSNPITGETNITVMNAFSLIIPQFSYIPLEKFLKYKYLEEIQVYEIDTEKTIKISQIYDECEKMDENKWIAKLCKRSWAVKNKEKNLFLKINSLLPETSFFHHIFKRKEINIEEYKDDLKFLSNVWPIVLKLLLDNEFRFALAIANEDNVMHILADGITKGFIDYDNLKDTSKFKDLIPEFEGNKTIIVKKEPTKTIGEISDDFQVFLQSCLDEENKVKEINFNRLQDLINSLNQTCGKPLIPKIKGEKQLSLITFDEEKSEEIILSNGKRIRIYENQNTFPQIEDENILREILFYIDGIATPENQYNQLRNNLIKLINRE